MPWFKVHCSLDDMTTGKHISLQNMFDTLFHRMHEPAGAALCVNGSEREDYTYYFASPCPVFSEVILSACDVCACKPPMPQSIVWLAGDVSARGALQRA